MSKTTKLVGLLLLTLIAAALTGLGDDLGRKVITVPSGILTLLCLVTLVNTYSED